ncbi:MAG: hypothetical protein ACOC70_00915, partial [bacterium]
MTWTPGQRVGAALAALLLAVVTGLAGAAEPPPRPPVPANLLPNPDFEIDADRDGVPDGWHHSDPQYWTGPPPNSKRWNDLHERWVETGAVPENIPFRAPKTAEGGRYGWEATGIGGGHCISIDQTGERKWGEWNAVVEGIEKNTDYVILGRRRQMVSGSRRGNGSPWMEVAAFGQTIPIKGTIDEGAWVPFAVTVNSGGFAGACRVGFIVKQAPTKVWLDRVALFKGTLADLPRFHLGLQGARLDYPYHAAAYASPDLPCPLFFDVLWSFHDANGAPGLGFELDLPAGLAAAPAEGTGLELAAPTREGKPLPQPQAVQIAGRAYRRWTFHIPAAEDRPAFRPGGKRPVRLWLRTDPKLAAGTFRAYYRATWKGGSQPVQPLTIEVIRVPEIRRSKVLAVCLGGLSARLLDDEASGLTEALVKRGINCVLTDGALDAKTAAALQKAGAGPAAWFELGGEDVPKACLGRDAKGDVVPGVVCPSCRPENAIETIFAEPAGRVREGVTMLFVDLRDGLSRVCYCERCAAEFEGYVRKKRDPELEFVPPAKLAAEPGKHKEVRALWDTFRAEQFAGLYWTLRERLDKFRKEAEPAVPNASIPLKLYALVPPASRGREAARRAAMIDYAKLANVFDAELVDPEMHLSENGGTPAVVGREASALAKLLPLGGKVGAVITAGTSDDPAAVAPVFDRRDIRDQVLEAVIGGARVVVLRHFRSVDGLDLKRFTEAIDLVAPFDEIIAEGEPVPGVSVAKGRGRVRALGKP